METAVIYARFSSHRQTEQSIEGQLHVCYEYAQRKGIRIVGEYIDRALTGRSDDRPDFQRMISDARKKAFDYVLVYKLDRFARNRYDSAIYKHKLKQYGVKVLSAMENIGDNPESIILEAVLEASAEYYSVDLSQKIKRGRRESASKGKYVGGSLPYGYYSENGRILINEKEAPLIQEFFQRYADGESKKQIIDDFNARGYRNQNGKPYGPAAFQRALRCEKYIGVLEQCGTRIENGCPALIDRETFEKVQQRLDQNRQHPGHNKAKIRYLLSGKAYCGNCGQPMTGVSGRSKTGNLYYYYTCFGRRRLKNCKKKHEKKDFLEWYVVEQTLEYVLTPERMEKIAAAVAAEYQKDFGTETIQELERLIRKYDRESSKCVDMLLEVPESAHQKLYEKIEKAEACKADLEIDLAKLRIASKIQYTEKEVTAWMKLFCKGDLMDPAFRERIIDTFINSVFVYDDKIVIFYNIRGGKQVSYIEMKEAEPADFLFDEDFTESQPGSTFKVCGGGGESRTPVRKPIHPAFSERSRLFEIPS